MFARASASNLDLIAAGVAFYAMLALFPMATAVIALWGLFFDPTLVAEQLETLHGLVPKDAFALLESQVDMLVTANSGTLACVVNSASGCCIDSLGPCPCSLGRSHRHRLKYHKMGIVDHRRFGRVVVGVSVCTEPLGARQKMGQSGGGLCVCLMDHRKLGILDLFGIFQHV